LVNKIITGAKIVTFPFWKPFASTGSATGHAKDMESFYKYQKEGYDAFRENLLHARSALIESMPLKKGGNMIWVDVGGGTARNLEFFTAETIRKYFKVIVIADISKSLLEVAQKRVELMGLTDIVKCIEIDVTAATALKAIPVKEGTADVITMSYSYSMIPDQKAAMKNCSKLLRSGGHLAIADFFKNGNYDDCLPRFSKAIRNLESAFHTAWFAMDHVHLLGEEQLAMAGDSLQVVWDLRFRGGVPFLPFLQPFHGVYILAKK
jgi:S-adenosylmethionine-diacylgycerolhomoserine-N-methlytransferase